VVTIKITVSANAETKAEIERLINVLRWRLLDFEPSITITGGAPCDVEGVENGEGLTAIEKERAKNA